MSSSPDNPARRDLDAYLDGTLPPAARESIARQLGRDGELRSDVELQGRIDAALRRTFVPPPPPAAFLSQLCQSAPPSGSGVPRLGPRVLAVSAAAAMVVAVWGFLAWQYLPRRAVRPADPQNSSLETVYRQHVASGFQPDIAPKDDETIASTFFDRQGQRLVLRPLDAGSHFVGLAFCGGCGPRTTAILARVDDAPVMVFVDRASADIQPQTAAPCVGLHVFRREFGPLVAYEISPLDEPRIMNRLHPADSPAPSGNSPRP